MYEAKLAQLEDGLWQLIGSNPEPKFAFFGHDDLVKDAFLHVAALSHPFFGRAKLGVLSSESSQFATQFEKMSLAKSLGLISIETYGSIEELTQEAIVISASPLPKACKAKAVIDLNKLMDQDDLLLISADDPYRFVYACLSQYGTPLDRFCLPSEPTKGDLARDWHYLGPSRDLESYRVILDELLLALKKNDGSLCPKEAHAVILRALHDEKVSGQELYTAIKTCYDNSCLLRDLASYQHNTWILRTLAFHEDAKSKEPLMTPYPILLARELPKLKGLSLEESFSKDILYSNFLVPLYFLRTLIK